MIPWESAQISPLSEPSRSEILLFDTAAGAAVPLPPGAVKLYVCGITPYDATHMGHALTYLTFDTLVRVCLDAGLPVSYTQNLTDVDDPLLERAEQTGVNWRDLASSQTELFFSDMQALGVLAPQQYLPVSEQIPAIARAVEQLLEKDLAYRLDNGDIYFDSAGWQKEFPANLSEAQLIEVSARMGGDPERAGKRHPLDPLLWRSWEDPAWDTPVGRGRPGWHIGCAVLSLLGSQVLEAGVSDTVITVQGGGSDLVFPHHAFTAAIARSISGKTYTRLQMNSGMLAYQGHKMSKSRGNLVLVSRLRSEGVEPLVIRLALLNHHYREDWEWFAADLTQAARRLEAWRQARRLAAEPIANTGEAAACGEEADLKRSNALRQILANDLDTPAALKLIDQWEVIATPEAQAIERLLGIPL